MGSVLKEKQIQFNLAMKKYEDKSGYRFFGRLVSFTVIFLQTFILFYALRNPVALYLHPVIIVTCYILADFFNGLVHMYMDNNDNYNSVFGPFIQVFTFIIKPQGTIPTRYGKYI